jgi:hypothetical protein
VRGHSPLSLLAKCTGGRATATAGADACRCGQVRRRKCPCGATTYRRYLTPLSATGHSAGGLGQSNHGMLDCAQKGKRANGKEMLGICGMVSQESDGRNLGDGLKQGRKRWVLLRLAERCMSQPDQACSVRCRKLSDNARLMVIGLSSRLCNRHSQVSTSIKIF